VGGEEKGKKETRLIFNTEEDERSRKKAEAAMNSLFV
jgi:hypothetical protein